MSFIGNLVDNNAPPATDFAPIPSGEYKAVIDDSELKPTKNNAGQYLELTYKVIDGPMKGRLVWVRLNLDNPNAQAVAIAQQQWASVRAACGLGEVTDSVQVHNIPHIIRVEFVPAGPRNQRDGNEVKAWKRIEGATPIAATPAPTTAPYAARAQAASPAPAAAPPWANKAA